MASPVDTSVKHAYSSMAGAPLINGTAGSYLAALDAFLVTGWGIKSVDSAAVSGGVCRLAFASGKSAAEVDAVILVSGATPGGLNGEQKVTAVASGWVEFKTALPDGPVTGGISFKMAPLGWEKVFSKTNVAVYRPTDPASTRTFYRVDDSGAISARVQMYESMTDVDTGIAVSPLTVPGGYWWHKRNGASATGVYWVMVGDARGFYTIAYQNSTSPATNGSNGGASAYMGDANSLRSGDAWCAVLTGSSTSAYNATDGCAFMTPSASGMTLKRMAHGIGGAVQTQRRLFGTVGNTSGMDNYLGTFPSTVDNSLHLAQIYLTDGTGSMPRGMLPGAYHCPQSSVLAGFGWDVALTNGQGQFAGRKLLSTHIGLANAQNQGLAFFDVTGPWRT